MKEIKFVKKEVIEPELVAITCNCCAKRHESRTCYDEELANFHSFEVEGGYGSKYPQDLDRISFTLCSDCLQALIK